jgi:transcriptional regulator with XRE-family HTH domain
MLGPVSSDQALEKLGLALRGLVRREGLLLRDLSEELGFGPDYLGRAFRGRYPLRVELVFRILQRLTVLPFIFFDSIFPFGGPLTLESAKAREVTDLPEESPWAEFFRDQMLDQRPRTLAEYPRRFGEWLRTEIAERGLRQKAISEALEMGSYALGQALRGNTDLTFFHVFGVLEHVKISPARFFVEVLSPEPATAAERLQRRRALDYYESTFETTARLFLERREARAREATKKVPEAAPVEGEPREENGEPQ